MARQIGRLSAVQVGRLAPGLHADGGGLYLHVGPSGARSWIYRYMLDRRAREMGLGPVHTVGLAEARRRAAECRLRRLDGIDPIAARRDSRAAQALDNARGITFRAAAAQYIAANRAAWKSPKHAAQWEATLGAYAYPHFGALAVAAVDVGLVLQALEPIWSAIPETASRLRGRIESILDWAAARGYRGGDNPARWRGHLDQVLPRPSAAKRAKRRAHGRAEHHAALPYADLPAFLGGLRRQNGVAARALEFAVLTAARTGEVLGARQSEIAGDVWVIPAERMKSGAAHQVPLSGAALALLPAPPAQGRDAYLFAAERADRPLSDMALLMLLRRMAADEPRWTGLTVHGFRSSFRDWAAEARVSREVAEMALAHAVGDKVEAAYLRTRLFDQRREVMAAWSEFCAGAGWPKEKENVGQYV